MTENKIINVEVNLSPPFVWRPEYAILLDAEPERARQFAKEHDGCFVFLFMTCKPGWLETHALPDYSDFCADPDNPAYDERMHILPPIAIGNLDHPMKAIDEIVSAMFPPDFGPCEPTCIHDERPTENI